MWRGSPDIDPNTGKAWVRCPLCDAPMLPPGVKKKPHEYDHASGCPHEGKSQREVHVPAGDV